MPGTIQVTVLEFKGASSSSQPSAKSLKVSMGKKYYQTWDKGDFSFPVTKLKEDLIVILLDAGENEIAHADIRTIQVIEKGYWDEVFSLEGGGNVHMKLQFTLSEEERKRIRVMRESAMKKKQETKLRFLNNSSAYDSVQTPTHSEQKISDSQKTFVQIDVVSPSSLDSATSSIESPFSYQEQERQILGSAISNVPDRGQDASSPPVKHEIEEESPQLHESVPVEKVEADLPFPNTRPDIKEEASSIMPLGSVTSEEKPEKLKIKTRLPSTLSVKNSSIVGKLEDAPIHESRNIQGPMKKSPSKVWKMISAFETSQVQEPKSPKKAPKIVIQPADRSLRNFKDDILTENSDQTSTTVSKRADIVSRNTEQSQASVAPSPSKEKASNVEDISREAPLEPIVNELEKPPFNVMGKSNLETATNSGKTNEEQSREASSVVDISREAPREPIVKELESTTETSTKSGKIRDEQSRAASNGEDISSEGLREPIVDESEKEAPFDVMGQSILETATDSGGIHEEQSREYSDVENISREASWERDSGRIHEEQSRETGLKSSTSTNIKRDDTNQEQKSVEYCDSSESSGMWIFPDNTRGSCITAAGEGCLESKPHQANAIYSEPEMLEKNKVMHGTKYNKMAKDPRDFARPTKSGSGSSPDNSSNGLVGQVIKIVVILGFGVLVFLTRQKEPRKKNREENANLFAFPGYTDGRTLTG